MFEDPEAPAVIISRYKGGGVRGHSIGNIRTAVMVIIANIITAATGLWNYDINVKHHRTNFTRPLIETNF